MYWSIESSTPYDYYDDVALMGKGPPLEDFLPDFSWVGGVKIDVDLPTPLKFYLDSGDFLSAFYMPVIPLMSEKMLSILSSSGVDNIQAYEADIYDTNHKKIEEKYFAINIVDRIECVDLEKSIYRAQKSSRRLRFKKIIIDENKAHGALLFRLYEKPSTVVIHDSIKKNLEKSNLPGIGFKNLWDEK